MLMTFEMLKSLNEQESILRILYCPFFDCLMETINLWIKIKGSINLFSRVVSEFRSGPGKIFTAAKKT